jgi:gliding motility-associated-like protein
MIRYLLLTVFILPFCGFVQELPKRTWILAAPVNTQQSQDSQEIHTAVNWVERTEERTFFSQMFTSPSGQTRQVFSSVPLHYSGPHGELLPYDLRGRTEDSYTIFEQQEHPILIFNDGSFALKIGLNDYIQIGKNTSIEGQLITKELGTVGEFTSLKFVEKPIFQQLEIGNGKIGFHYRIHEPIPLEGPALVIKEHISLPRLWKIVENKTSTDGYLFIQDEKGIKRAILTNILCYDANGNSYSTSFEINGSELHIKIPTSWLENPERIYPITIDPLLAGIPSIWSGGLMPSCFMPTYNEDSIQVTIPAGITPTGVYVDASFYANPFTFSTMAQGSMYFSSSCGSSQTFTVTGATAGLAGTAYLDSFNLMNPLVCCLQKSCNPIQFWVSMHLGRNANGPGCNTDYIRYDPLTTSWPFQVIVYGRSPESYGNEWYTSQTPICSNKCQVSATGYARYGVPPYTFSHPWTTTIGTAGQNLGCNSGASNFVFTLDIPNCPVYCDSNYTALTIPPPIIVDACGTYITGLQNATKPLIAAIEPQLSYDSIICNGENIIILNEPCISDGVTMFSDQNTTGYGSINTLIMNNNDSVITQIYHFTAERLGCKSDTINVAIQIVPLPSASLDISPNPLVVGNTATISNTSISLSGAVLASSWWFEDSIFQEDSLTVQFNEPGNYNYCLYIVDAYNCMDTSCAVLAVIPADIENINVITPNGDGINDALFFEYLDFYPGSQLVILNRWGTTVFESLDYKNDWDGAELLEGTYFYKLTIPGLNKTLQSFFELDR